MLYSVAVIKLEIPEIPETPLSSVLLAEVEEEKKKSDAAIKRYFELRREQRAGDESAGQKIIDLAIENNLDGGLSSLLD